MKDALLEPCLFGYWRSSAAYLVRIALNLKAIAASQVPVQLQAGEQKSADYRALNPAGLVPLWREPDGFTLAQSLAIIEYLDEKFPNPPLLPDDFRQKALCREIAYAIACDIHPAGNLRVLEKLTADYGAGPEAGEYGDRQAGAGRSLCGVDRGALRERAAAVLRFPP